jgi:outer membrane lipoprotein-sorting protein
MTTKSNRSKINNGTKWIHVKAQGLCGFLTVVVSTGQTVWQFKELLGVSAETNITVPTTGFPLADDVKLFEFVQDFDTVWLSAY